MSRCNTIVTILNKEKVMVLHLKPFTMIMESLIPLVKNTIYTKWDRHNQVGIEFQKMFKVTGPAHSIKVVLRKLELQVTSV